MIFIFTPFQSTEQFFAVIVMPRSRSRSILSIIRSSMTCLSWNKPLCLNIESTSVVLP